MRPSASFLSVPLACFVCLVLSGCSLSSTAHPAPDAGLAIQGRVQGGQQPITGAHVYLFAANTTGYAGPGITASTTNKSLSLLTTGSTDSVGTYVTTDPNGNFTITGDYSCTPNTQVYIYALGGNPGLTAGTNNTASGLLAALGNCPSAGNFLSTTPYVFVDEVSTIAAATLLPDMQPTRPTSPVQARHWHGSGSQMHLRPRPTSQASPAAPR